MRESQHNVRRYFSVKAEQLKAAAALPSSDHAGLAGGHREEFQRIYLRELLPRRYEIGRGIVYGFMNRSREADIVVWDSANYPSLPLSDHSFYFAESVRAVVESKSRWSADDFDDVRKKSRAVRDILQFRSEPDLAQQIAMMQLDIAGIKHGREHDGMLVAQHHIATVAVFLSGGTASLATRADVSRAALEDADDSWPDLMLLLEAGRVVVKDYSSSGQHLLFFELGDDALLFFTHSLLRLLADRIVSTEAPFYFDAYAGEIVRAEPYLAIPFAATRFPPMRQPLWRGGQGPDQGDP